LISTTGIVTGRRYPVREALQPDSPAVRRPDGGVHRLPALTVALDLAVLELDPRPIL
jgi:hypothetical protein